MMSNWSKAAIALVGGVALGAGVSRVKPAEPADGPPTALGAIPPQRESLVVMKHLLETRADARSVRFAAWYPPAAVESNPYTPGPATAVRLVLQPGGEAGVYELWVAHVRGDRVLGVAPAGGMEVTAPGIATASVRVALAAE